MEERMGFARMTALSAVTALVGATGLYATAAPVAGQERRVIIERDGDGPDRVSVSDGQDDAHDKGGKRVIVRKVGGDGPGFDVFAMGGSRVGMVVRDVETADVTKEKLAGTAGAVVTEVVKDSAAQKAGVKAGDVVTSFDGERVRSARQLERLVEETPAGRTVKVALQRAGAPVTLDVTPETPKMTQAMPGMAGEGGDVFKFERRAPGQGPEWEGPQGMPFKFEMPAGRFDFDAEPFMAASRGRLGVRVQDLSEELAGYFGVKSGVLVAGVEADAPAAKAGLKAGDVITAVNGQAITEPGELRREVAKVEDGKTADLAVTRDKKPLTLKVEVTARDRTVERKQRRSL
jgi:membrane-associated protease RseP (regulator of RpoE activity)